MPDEKLGIEFLSKLAGFDKLTRAAKNVDKLKKSAEKATGGITRMNQAVQRLGATGDRMKNWGGKMMMQTGLVYQAAQDLTRKFYTVVDAFGSVEQKGVELGTVLAPLGGSIKKSIDLATNSALDFSRKYSASATEIMEAQYLIASAGITQPLITVKAAEWTMKLARATRQDLSSTADIWASTANTFYNAANMTEGEMQKLSDTLTKTQQQFQFKNLLQLGDGMKYAGIQAKNLGISIDLTSTLLGTLNSTGLQGTLAGTSLKQTFLKLGAVGKKLRLNFKETAEGGTDVIDAFKQIKASVADLSKVERVETIRKLFGEEAMSAVLIFLDKLDQVESDYKAIAGAVGVTEKSFAEMEATQNAAFARMRNNLTHLFYIVGNKLSPTLNKVIENIISLVNKISDFAEQNPLLTKIVGLFLGIGAAIAGIGIPLMMLIGMMTWGIGSAISLVTKLGLQFTILGTKIGATTGKMLVFNKGMVASVGLLGKISAIGAAAFVGWGIGRLIGELTGFDKVIQDLYGRLFWAKELAQEKYYGAVPKERLIKIREFKEAAELPFVNIKSVIKDYNKLFNSDIKTREELLKRLRTEEHILLRQISIKEGGLKPDIIKTTTPKTPTVPKLPTPDDLGIPQPVSITAGTRPELNNYYYTIHFERDSIQINTLDLSPEKFMSLLQQVIKRQSLTPSTL